GFAERLRIGGHRIQLTYGDGAVVVVEGSDGQQPAFHATMVRVADAAAHCERARSCGARIVREPADYPYGERQYTAQDPGGHLWTFTQSIADVDPRDWGGVPVEAKP
ncbi:MAG TPA: VOC family protein, partial [Rhodanobacteraceae bacterium]|nr:VOC family protein [Rhodanobacteraceae bacterium]